MVHRSWALALVALVLAACASAELQNERGIPAEATADSYGKGKGGMGVVLLDARWARQWPCGEYGNAQLVSFHFDKMPLASRPDDAPAEIMVTTSRRLAVSPDFQSYALLVPPGEYALSNYKIKVAKSVSDLGYWVASRSHLIKDGKPLGGTFSVAPGEVVYIGNFALDCFKGPSLWRYHAKGKDGFKQQLTDYQTKYPFLDLSNVQFRLFETETLGQSYTLE
jgi:hypothetical protein